MGNIGEEIEEIEYDTPFVTPAPAEPVYEPLRVEEPEPELVPV